MEEYELRMLNLFKALGNKTRYKILRELHRNKEMTVSELVQAVKRPQNTVSRHLHILRKEYLVSFRTVGSNVLYSLKKREVIKLLSYAEEIVKRR